MKNVTFKTEGQNIYITYTTAGSRVITELYCIAIGQAEAEIICKALNYAKDNNTNFYL